MLVFGQPLMTGWFILCIVLTIAEVWSIALVAHAAGCILGALLGWTISTSKLGPRLLRGAILTATFLLCIAGGTVARPYVNLVNDIGPALADQGRAAWEAGDAEQAIVFYKQAVDANPKVDDWWTSLGLAYQQAGRMDDARDAFNHATQLRNRRSKAK